MNPTAAILARLEAKIDNKPLETKEKTKEVNNIKCKLEVKLNPFEAKLEGGKMS